jgi:hypothetical protein
MRTLPIVSLVLAVVALGGAPATATGQLPGTDSVTGQASGCVEFFVFPDGSISCSRDLSIDVDVESGPAGENPTGTVLAESIGLSPSGSRVLTAEATCLSVAGRTAIIGFTGSERNLGQPIDTPIEGLVRVLDAGGPNSGADTAEVIWRPGDPSGPPLPGPTSCSTFPGPFPTSPFFLPEFTNETGDLVVTDAPPLPTSKEQCKNDGWRNFPTFKNQGDCTSFVSRRRS